jgi:HEPN domain-containing protein
MHPPSPDYAQFRETCLIIDQYYVPTRYPNGVPGSLPGDMPGDREATEAIKSADSILSFTLQQI